MTKLWAAVVGAAPQLAGWIGRGSGGLDVARLPRPAWPIVAGAVARAITERGVSVVILVPGPDRFAGTTTDAAQCIANLAAVCRAGLLDGECHQHDCIIGIVDKFVVFRGFVSRAKLLML